MQWLKKRRGSVEMVSLDLPPDLIKIHQESWDAHIWVCPWGDFQRLTGGQRTKWRGPPLRGVPSNKLTAQMIWDSREEKPALASVSSPWVWSCAADSGGHETPGFSTLNTDFQQWIARTSYAFALRLGLHHWLLHLCFQSFLFWVS